MLKRLCRHRIYLSKLHRDQRTKQKAEFQLEYTTVDTHKMFYDGVLRCFLLELYIRILTFGLKENTETTIKTGSQIKDVCRNSDVSLSLSNFLPQGVQEKMEKLGGRSAPRV